MKHFKQHFKQISSVVIQKPLTCLVFIMPLIALVAYAFYVRQIMHSAMLEYALIDLAFFAFAPRFFSLAIVLLWSLVIAVVISRDNTPVVIVQYSSRQRIWLIQSQQITMLCSIYAFTLTCAFMVIGLLLCDNFVNFTSTGSYFYLNTGVTLNVNIPISLVLILYFTIILVFTNSMCLLIAFSKWIFNNHIIGIFIAIAIAAFDIFFVQENSHGILYGYGMLYYAKWLDVAKMFADLLVPISVSAVLFIAGFFVSGKKEFFNA